MRYYWIAKIVWNMGGRKLVKSLLSKADENLAKKAVEAGDLAFKEKV